MLRFVFPFLLLATLASCGLNRPSLAERCAAEFPSRADTVYQAEVITDTLVIPDTYVEYLDTTICPPNLTDSTVVTRTVVRRVPGQTIYLRDTVYMRQVKYTDGPLVGRLQEEARQHTVELAELRGSRATLRWTTATLGLLILIMVGSFAVRRLRPMF
jgi:hypothetical protein